jgi:hypothetical protein
VLAWTPLTRHGCWYLSGLALAFAMSFCLTDLLHLPRDLYYGLYAVAVAAFFIAWARNTGQSLSRMLRRRLALASVLGLLVGGVLVVLVIRTEPATAGPHGAELAAALLWRGVVYGAADGLLLSAFPILAVVAATRGSRLRRGARGRVLIGAVAMLASLLMTIVYHLGYPDFRSAKLAKPVTGDLIWSVPTLVTLNPAGAPIAHAGLHVAAVLHAYDTDTFLPPHG